MLTLFTTRSFTYTLTEQKQRFRANAQVAARGRTTQSKEMHYENIRNEQRWTHPFFSPAAPACRLLRRPRLCAAEIRYSSSLQGNGRLESRQPRDTVVRGHGGMCSAMRCWIRWKTRWRFRTRPSRSRRRNMNRRAPRSGQPRGLFPYTRRARLGYAGAKVGYIGPKRCFAGGGGATANDFL